MSVVTCNYAVIFILCKHFVYCLYWNKENDTNKKASSFCIRRQTRILCANKDILLFWQTNQHLWLVEARICNTPPSLRASTGMSERLQDTHQPFLHALILIKRWKHARVVVSESWVCPNWLIGLCRILIHYGFTLSVPVTAAFKLGLFPPILTHSSVGCTTSADIKYTCNKRAENQSKSV